MSGLFRPESDVARWQTLYEYAKTVPDGTSFSLLEVIALIEDEHGAQLSEDRARALIAEMNRHVYVDGVRVMAVGKGGLYTVGTPAEKLSHATDTVSARIKSAIADAKRANIATLKDDRATDLERAHASDSLNHWDTLAVAARRNRVEQLKLRPELPVYRHDPRP
jgi:hypothetical protein